MVEGCFMVEGCLLLAYLVFTQRPTLERRAKCARIVVFIEEK